MAIRVEAPSEKVDQCKSNVMEKTSEKKRGEKVKQFLKETWAFRTKITVEPFVLCYVLPSVLSGLAVQNLSLEKACQVDYGYNATICNSIMDGNPGQHAEEWNKMRAAVVKMTGWSHPVQSVTPGLLMLFIGAWSDRTGRRKPFMVIPILGKLVSGVGILLSTIFFMSVGMNMTALIEGLPPALAGGRVAMTMAVFSHVTDITTEEERSSRLHAVQAVVFLSRPIGLALSGYMTRFLGYTGVFSVSCVFYVTGLVYIILRLKETPKKKIESEKSEFSIVTHLKSTVKVIYRKRPENNRIQVVMIIFAYIFVVGPVLGEAQYGLWYARDKFSFREVDYSLFLTYSVIVNSLGSMITIYLFNNKLKFGDSTICFIGCLSRMAAGVVYGVATTRLHYFLGPLMDMFSSASSGALRAMATKVVEPDEFGKISLLISVSEALVQIIYTPVYSLVYDYTSKVFPGTFYLISAALTVPAMILVCTLRIYERKSKKPEATKQAPETNSNNEITPL